MNPWPILKTKMSIDAFETFCVFHSHVSITRHTHTHTRCTHTREHTIYHSWRLGKKTITSFSTYRLRVHIPVGTSDPRDQVLGHAMEHDRQLHKVRPSMDRTLGDRKHWSNSSSPLCFLMGNEDRMAHAQDFGTAFLPSCYDNHYCMQPSNLAPQQPDSW